MQCTHWYWQTTTHSCNTCLWQYHYQAEPVYAMHACVAMSNHSCMHVWLGAITAAWWCYSDVYLKPVAQAMHPCSALCFNADRLCRPARVQAAPVLLPSLKHILLDPAPQLKAHLCLIRLVPCLQRKDVKPVCQCIVLPDRTQTAVLHLCWLWVCLSAACISRHQRLS